MNLAKLKAVIEADARKFHSVLKGVDVATERVFGGIRGRIQRLKKDFRNELGKGLSIGFGTALAMKGIDLVGRGVRAVTDFIGDSINASRDLSETLSKSSVVFGQSARDILAWGGTAATAFGMSKQAAIEAAASFGNVFIGLDIGQDKAAVMSKRLVGLAGDLASFNNLNPAEALEKLSAGLAGESEPLRRVGVFMSEAKVKAKAMQMGLGNVHDELTEGRKILARYQLILDSTSTAQGDFARTSEGLANSQRTATASLIDAQAGLGAAFEPIALQVTNWQIDFIAGVGLATDALLGLGRGFGDAVDAIIPWDSATERATKEAAALAMSARDILAWSLERGAPAVAAGATAMLSGLPQAVTTSGNKAFTNLNTEINSLLSLLSGRRNDFVKAATGVADATWDPQIHKAELALVNIALKDKDLLERLGSKSYKIRSEAGLEFANLNKDQARLRASMQADRALGQAELEQALVVRNSTTAALNKTMRDDTAARALDAASQWAEQFERGRNRAGAAATAMGAAARTGILDGWGKVVTLKANINVNSTALATGARAVGGPVWKGGLFKVGERGEEWFVPKADGMILPHGRTPAMAAVEGRSAGDGGGGDSYTFHITSSQPDNAKRDISRVMRRLEGLGIVGNRAWSGSG